MPEIFIFISTDEDNETDGTTQGTIKETPPSTDSSMYYLIVPPLCII